MYENIPTPKISKTTVYKWCVCEYIRRSHKLIPVCHSGTRFTYSHFAHFRPKSGVSPNLETMIFEYETHNKMTSCTLLFVFVSTKYKYQLVECTCQQCLVQSKSVIEVVLTNYQKCFVFFYEYRPNTSFWPKLGKME